MTPRKSGKGGGQIEKLVEVLRAFSHTEDEVIHQEIALYKVPTKAIAGRKQSGGNHPGTPCPDTGSET